MMNKCAKFHKDSVSGKKVRFNLPSAIEPFGFCSQPCIETLCKRATLVAHLTNFSFEFFYEIFTEDASLLHRYHDAKRSKMTKNSNQGGGVRLLYTTLRHSHTHTHTHTHARGHFGVFGSQRHFPSYFSSFLSVLALGPTVIPVYSCLDLGPETGRLQHV